MANAVDWTVDKLLSSVQTLNARAESAQNTIRANRATYNQTLRSLSSIPDQGARESLRAKLRDWIHRQVDVENRFNEFARNFTAAKLATKRFLESVSITPPSYLGFVVPAAVYGGVAVALAVIATISALNSAQTKSISVIGDLVKTARERGWSAKETAEAIRAAGEATPSADPLGLANTLKAALPILLIGGALFLFGPMLQRRLSRA